MVPPRATVFKVWSAALEGEGRGYPGGQNCFHTDTEKSHAFPTVLLLAQVGKTAGTSP